MSDQSRKVRMTSPTGFEPNFLTRIAEAEIADFRPFGSLHTSTPQNVGLGKEMNLETQAFSNDVGTRLTTGGLDNIWSSNYVDKDWNSDKISTKAVTEINSLNSIALVDSFSNILSDFAVQPELKLQNIPNCPPLSRTMSLQIPRGPFPSSLSPQFQEPLNFSNTYPPLSSQNLNFPLNFDFPRRMHSVNREYVKDRITEIKPLEPKLLQETSSIKRVSWNCSSHSKETVFYCEDCKAAICVLCAIYALGEHHAHRFEPKTSSRKANCDKIVLVNSLNGFMSRICTVLSDFKVKTPFVFDKEEKCTLFNVDLTNFKAFKNATGVGIVLETVNTIIRHLSRGEGKHPTLGSHLETAIKGFDELEEFQGLKEPSSGIVPIHDDKEGAIAQYCTVQGQGTHEAVVGIESCFYLSVKNKQKLPCRLQDVPLDINAVCISTPERRKAAIKTNYHYLPGVLKVSFKFPNIGMYNICIRVNEEEIPQSPLEFFVKEKLKFHPKMEYKYRLGDSDSFNKPYGVCLDKDSNVYITDRCNNCVKVFTRDLKFKRTIGESGEKEGQLKKPAGICIDKENNVVVCDKDNHRVQVFTTEGILVKCSNLEDAKLKFPWAVSVNSNNQYVVTHEKHKVCLMSSALKSINDITVVKDSTLHGETLDFKSPLLSPRGVLVGYYNEIIVSDFEEGSLYTIDKDSGKPIECFNIEYGVFDQKRYQALTQDSDGYLLAADSKNCKIDVFTYAGNLVSSWDVPAKPLCVAELDHNRYIVTTDEGVMIFGRGECTNNGNSSDGLSNNPYSSGRVYKGNNYHNQYNRNWNDRQRQARQYYQLPGHFENHYRHFRGRNRF